MAIDKAAVWRRITQQEGETFRQIRGGEFTYRVRGRSLSFDRTTWGLSRGAIDEALDLVPLADTTVVQHLSAPSYIYAILMDRRIRANDW